MRNRMTLGVLVLSAVVAGQAISWQATTSLPRSSWRHACAATAGRIYFMGGGNGPEASCDYAAVNPDGTLGQWVSTTPLPAGIGWFSADATEGHIYICGGWNGGGLTNAVQHAMLDSTGAIGNWSPTTSLPGVVYTHGAIIADSFLYVLGGATGIGAPVIADVRCARIQPDGSLGGWSATTSLPQPMRIMGVTVRDSWLYSVGGRDGSGNAAAVVYFCRRSPDGSLGQWIATTSLPVAIDGMTCAVLDDRIYSAGGMTYGALNNVYSAPIAPDGTLGDWVAETSLPAARWASDGVAVNGRLYVPGGYDSGPYADVYYSSPLTGVSEGQAVAARPQLSIRPNPTHSGFVKAGLDGPAVVSVHDAAGRCVQRQESSGVIDLRSLSPGVYYCRVEPGTATARITVVR